MPHTKRIHKILQEISLALDHFIQQEQDPGLLSGYGGCALFYAYYYRLTGKRKCLQQLQRILLKMMNALAEQEMIPSHCSGVAGIAWSLQHLMNQGFIEAEGVGDIFRETDELLSRYILEELALQRYDFLHQGLGAALYFLERPADAAGSACLSEVVALLERSAVTLPAGISWEDQFTRKDTAGVQYNLGLAHGVPAILSVLSLLYEKGIAVARTRPLLEKGVQWLLTTRNEPGAAGNSLYPTMVTADNTSVGSTQSRLGWCYGDMGIAITLWNIGSRLQTDAYKGAARDILTHTLQHRNRENGSVRDAGLCHGSAGIAQIYSRVFKSSGDEGCGAGAAYWLQETLQFGNWQDGPAGFKCHTLKGSVNTCNLLEGITGIGLALIAALDNDTPPAWDRCLLLS